MNIKDILIRQGMSQYRLSKESGVPYATLNDILNGKTELSKCAVNTVYRITTALGVSIDELVREEYIEKERERAYEYGLPEYLQKDLDAFKNGLKNGSTLFDCLWGELYGSINAAEISDGLITPEHADYLRQKFLWR